MTNINTTPAATKELEAFLQSLADTPPEAATACLGWTAHELVAHLAAGAAELALALGAYADGDVVPPTRGFYEREAPYRAMRDADLRRSLVDALERNTAALAAVAAAEPDAVIPWTGRQVPVAVLGTHVRSELALHRWDLVGDDSTSDQLLAQPELTAHAVLALGRVLTAQGILPENRSGIALRSPDRPDVVLVSDQTATWLELSQCPHSDAAIDTDPAARLLLLWGRRPNNPGRIRAPGGAQLLAQVQRALAGY